MKIQKLKNKDHPRLHIQVLKRKSQGLQGLNVPADTPIIYYKRSIGIRFIDILLQQFQNRFSADNCWPVIALLNLIPSSMVKQRMPSAGQIWIMALQPANSEVIR